MGKQEEHQGGFSRWRKRRKNLQDADKEMEECFNQTAKSDSVPMKKIVKSTIIGQYQTDLPSALNIPAGLSQLPNRGQFENPESAMSSSRPGSFNVDVTMEETPALSVSKLPDLQSTAKTVDKETTQMRYDEQQTFEDIFEFFTAEIDSSSDSEEEGESEVHSSVYLPMLSIALYLRHNLTKAALGHHLLILRIGTHSNIQELASPHNLLSKYSQLKSDFSKILVCPTKKCPSVLQMRKDKTDEPEVQQPCGHRFIKNKHTACFIIKMPIEKQLKYFIEHHGLKKEDWDPNFRGDIQSGGCYKKLCDLGKIDDLTITVTWNTDGAQAFNMSKNGFWPFMATINEAKYKLRRAYVVLLALWYGNKKPPIKAFLDWIIEEWTRLERDGIMINGTRYKVRVLIITTDTVARPVIRNTSQYNGEYGCDFCLHPGQRVKKGRGSTRVYPEPVVPYNLRSMEQHRENLKVVQRTGKPYHGICGPTPLADLPGFDFIKAFVPEYMHSCCQGNFKLSLNLWTDQKYGKQPWSIRRKISIVNTRLSLTKPPYEITRTMGPVDDLSNWKASMYRNFALFFFVVLEGILPDEYFDHFMNLSYGMFVLLQEKVSVEDVKKVEVLFRRYIQDTQKLYGIEYVGINVHFLSHLAQSVLDWGCLWATSTFIPEWFNGELLSLCNGTQSVADQMAKNYLTKLVVRDEVTKLMSKDKFPPKVESTLKELLHLPHEHRNFSKGLYSNENAVEVLGNPKIRNISMEEKLALRNLFSIPKFQSFRDQLPITQCKFFPRFKLLSSGSIFTTTSYTKSPKRSNYCALMSDNNIVHIENLVLIESCGQSRLIILAKVLGAESKKPYLPKPIDGITFSVLPGMTTKLVGKAVQLVAYDVLDVVAKCVIGVEHVLTDTYVVTALPNKFETD